MSLSQVEVLRRSKRLALSGILLVDKYTGKEAILGKLNGKCTGLRQLGMFKQVKLAHLC